MGAGAFFWENVCRTPFTVRICPSPSRSSCRRRRAGSSSAGEGFLVVGKENVGIVRIEPVGRYAVRIVFDDGHATGLYTWPILYELGRNRERNWARYLERLEKAGKGRAPQ